MVIAPDNRGIHIVFLVSAHKHVYVQKHINMFMCRNKKKYCTFWLKKGLLSRAIYVINEMII